MCCVQEEEERFRPGTNKAVSLQVLKDAGVEGMSLGEIMEVSQQRGLKDWEPGAKRILQFVSHSMNLRTMNTKSRTASKATQICHCYGQDLHSLSLQACVLWFARKLLLSSGS